MFAFTRSEENADRFFGLGLTPIIGDITKPDSLDNLPDVDTVLYSVGIDRNVSSNIHEVYVKGLANALNHLSNVEQLIYVSSTGVYGDANASDVSPWIDESVTPVPSTEGGQACLEAESKLQDSMYANHTTIIRSAGIYGPGRVPGLKTIRGQNWSRIRGPGYLNLVHRDDLTRVILLLAEHEIVDRLYHVADGHPVERQVYYPWLAEQMKAPAVDWQEVFQSSVKNHPSKRISNAKLVKELDFAFRYTDYLHGIPGLLDK